MQQKDILINDFTDPAFEMAFKRYFADIGVNVRDWDRLFSEMNSEERNLAYMRFDEDDIPIGFIQFTIMSFSSWFFKTEIGFIREFWVEHKHRGQGHGSALLHLAEEYFIGKGVHKAILTTDTAEDFYVRLGYKKDVDIAAKNNDPVFIKSLS